MKLQTEEEESPSKLLHLVVPCIFTFFLIRVIRCLLHSIRLYSPIFLL